METEKIFFLYWLFFSLVTSIISLMTIARCKNVCGSLLLTYFIAQPFAWTMLTIGNGGGSIIVPIPDLIAITLFFTGFVTYEYGQHSINACLPPSPISTLFIFVIVFFIARRFKCIAYYQWFRKPENS